MAFRIRKLPVISLAALLAACLQLAACGGQTPPAPEVTTAPTAQARADLAASWPDDERIAYCPAFTLSAPVKTVKQENAQAKVYVMNYQGISAEDYSAYAALMEADEGIVVDTNTNLRDNAYSFNAHKADDAYMMIRMVYTRATQELVISVTYAHPDVTA